MGNGGSGARARGLASQRSTASRTGQTTAGTTSEPALDAHAAARRAVLDQRFGSYSDQARKAAVDHLLAQQPALVSALQEHYGGRAPLSVAGLAGHLGRAQARAQARAQDAQTGASPSKAARAQAQQVLGQLQALSEWSLLHGAGDTRINHDGTMTLYHGIHGLSPQQEATGLSRGHYREGKSFTSAQEYASRLASAYRQPGEQTHVLRADVPLSAIIAHDGLLSGLTHYQRTAYEHEYVLGTGVKLRNVRADGS